MFSLRPWKIGRIMGIPIGIDPSWLIIFIYLTFTLSAGVFPIELGIGRRGFNLESLALGVIASLLLFASVLAHELSHAWMAIRRGIPVLSITLFIFGGVAQIADEPDRPSTEFLIAIMGPLMSLALALVFAALWIWPRGLIGVFPESRVVLLPVAVVAGYLAQTNALLVLFNLLPGFPLDGGRVFRAIVWAVTHNLRRATYIAMLIGRVIAGLMIAGGLYLTLQQGWTALWFVLIGGFLWQASGEAYRSVLLRESLASVSVSRVMHTPVEHVGADLSIANFIEGFLLRQRAAVFAVDENGHVTGTISAEVIKNIPREKWSSSYVREAMIPLAKSEAVTPDDTALRVMQKLARRDHEHELPVLSDGEVVGIVGHEEIARYLQWKGK